MARKEECFSLDYQHKHQWTGAGRSGGYPGGGYQHVHYSQMPRVIKSKKDKFLIHHGNGEFTSYQIESLYSANKVRAYLSTKYSGGFESITESMMMGLYDEFGIDSRELDINNNDDKKYLKMHYPLILCNAGVDVPGEPKPENPPPHIKPGSGTQNKTIRNFKTASSTFHIDVNYKTFLCYGSIDDTISRGKARFYLYRGDTLVDTILSIDYNDEDSITKTYEGMPIGDYRLVMELEDTYQDTKQIYFNVNTRIRETKTTVNGTGERDDSKFRFHVINSVGQPVHIDGALDVVLDCNGTCKKCVRVEVPKGETYTVTGDLFKPSGITIGGPNGNGAALGLSDGVIKYDISARKFPLGLHTGGGINGIPGRLPVDVPVPGWDNGEPKVEEPSEPGAEANREGSYLWLDVFQVESATLSGVDPGDIEDAKEDFICYPLGTGTSINTEGIELNEFLNANPQLPKDDFFDWDVGMRMINPSEEDITVNIDFQVDDNFAGCGGGGEIHYFGGIFEFKGWDDTIGGDEDTEIRSKVDIGIREYHPNHTTVGGPSGSYAEVHLKHKGEIVKTYRVDDCGEERIHFDNLFQYGDSDFDVEIVTKQMGEVHPSGHDLRSIFEIKDFKLDTMFELNADNFDSKLDFYINNELKFTSDVIGSEDHYFDVKKGLNKYKMVFSTNLYDYNWDYVEIPWIRLTNWMCDAHEVTPYCDKGRGDKCVEALIGCVLGLLPKPIPKGCVTITYYDHETGEVLKQFTRYGYTVGEYIIEAENFAEFESVGDASKTVTVDESGICTPVDFYYRRTYRRCVYVYHMDCETGLILRKVPYYNLVPGKHYFNPVSIPNYRARPVDAVKFEAINTVVPIECEPIYFCYDWVGDKDPYLDCLIILHREYGNIENILETEQIINLTEGELEVHAKQYPGYRVVGSSVKFVNMRNITDPMECLSVSFEYEKIPLDCVIVKFVDRTTEKVLDTDFYYGLLPGEYTYDAKAFDGYKLVSEKSYTILITEESITDECKELTFLYEPISKGCALGRKIWIFT